MGWKLHRYVCECGNEYESLRSPDESHEAPCECGKYNEPAIAAPSVAGFSMLDSAGRAEVLKKRSYNHTKQMLKQQGKLR